MTLWFNKGIFITTVMVFITSSLFSGKENIPAEIKSKANKILKETKITGGLIIHLGCGDGKLTTALGAAGSYLVHGLDKDEKNIMKARNYIQSQGLYGSVSVGQLNMGLPYIDNLVDLVYSENTMGVSIEEVKRILAPGGIAYIKKGTDYQKIVKQPMKGTDDWTHYMHDSTGNAVANDTVVTPPKYLQWTSGPRWAKSHSNMGSIMGLVSANGRLFCILDEGYLGKDQSKAPPGWAIVAYDAYNGIVLWRKPILKWHDSFWRLKSGPAQLPERLAASDDRVFVTLDINGPVNALDAATGDLIYVCKESKGTEEILLNNNVLFLLRNPARENGKHKEPVRNVLEGYSGSSPYGEYPKEIMAVDAENGKVLWRKKTPVLATTLTVDDQKVYFHNAVKIVCLDRKNGKEIWASAPVARIKPVPANFTPTLVVYKDVVVFAAGMGLDESDKPDLVSAFNGKTGKKLWSAKQEKAYKAAPFGLFVINDIVWTGAVSGGGREMNPYTGRDMYTGKVVKTFKRDIDYVGSHSRCYRNKATVNYLLPNLRGIEMADINNKCWSVNLWARGGCSFGIMPANGMIYATPHACVCYAQSKLNGFNALYGDGMKKSRSKPKDITRLTKGPAFNSSKISRKDYKDEWPVFRHDNTRSCSIKMKISNKLKQSWHTGVGRILSPITIAGGVIYTAAVDEHAIHALDAKSGKKLWSYTVGARVDSPPTIYKGRAYFGSRDGFLYCLDALTGKLVWRFLCATEDKRLTSYSQIESVYPVHGSVLIQNDVLYCVAGRSMFLDGGLRMYRIDPETGKELSVNSMNNIDPLTKKNLQEKSVNQSSVPTMPDILSSDNKYIYMGVQQFDLKGKRTEIETHVKDKKNVLKLQKGEGVHLFSPSGFLDDARFHRNYWLYGKVYFGGNQGEWIAGRAAPSGNILAFNDTDVLGYYGYLVAGTLDKSIFSMRKNPKAKMLASQDKNQKKKDRQERKKNKKDKGAKQKKGGDIKLEYNWAEKAPIYVNSIVIANKTMFIAGSSDANEKGFLYLYSVDNGKKIAEYKLKAVPVFDGMACAKGAVYLALKDGSVVCYK